MADFKLDGKMIFMMFFGVIIAATFIVPIANSVIGQTETITIANLTVTVPAVNTSLDLTGRSLLTSINVSNETDPTQGNTSVGLFLRTGTSSGGLQTVQLFVNDSAPGYPGESVNVSYTAQPDGYLQDAGTRSITLLIILFSALAIVIFVIARLFEGSLKNIIGGKR